MLNLIDYQNGIHAFDADYVRPGMAAIHLIESEGRAAFVDTGTSAALPRAEAALRILGLDNSAVDYVILTHIHLDHAGGAGAMMAAFPNARLVVHPRGARHMAAPDKLFAGVKAVYGEAEATRLYGELLPVPAARIIEATDGLSLTLGAKTLVCLDSPGHARHHMVIHDLQAAAVFTGDTFGISYRECDAQDRALIFPSSTPVQFEPEALHASIDRILACQPRAVYLTHFSERTSVAELGARLHRLVDGHVAAVRRHADAGAVRHACVREELARLLLAEAQAIGNTQSEAELREIWATDLELNAQGLCVWLDQQEKSA